MIPKQNVVTTFNLFYVLLIRTGSRTVTFGCLGELSTRQCVCMFGGGP